MSNNCNRWESQIAMKCAALRINQFGRSTGMSYRNGKDIFPEEVLELVQQYYSGGILYIPSPEQPKKWGTNTDTKEKLARRNQCHLV